MTVQEIIEEIQSGMEEKGLTWRDVYIQSGVSRNTMVHWQHGKVGPNITTLQRILKTVGKKIEIVHI